MPPSEVRWQPALGVLAAGLVLGALLVWWVRRRGGGAAAAPAAPAAPLELRDLDGQVASLVAQLRELDDTAAKRTPEQLARERYALELAAARALMARDSLAPAPASAPAPAPRAAASGTGRGFLWGVLTSAAVGLLLWFVSQSAERRSEGGSPTGGTPGATQAGASQAGAPEPAATDDEHTRELRQLLEASPEDHETRLELARHLLTQRDMMGVWNETQHVLEHEPGHPRALTYQALVRLAMGQGELAVSMLQQAIAAKPDLIEARQNLAFVYASLGRQKEAEATVAELQKRAPQEAERLKQALAQLAEARDQQAAPAGSGEPNPHEGLAMPGAAGSQAENPHEGVAMPGAGAPAAPPPAQPAPQARTADGRVAAVFGWLEADAAVAGRIRPGTAIFLTVREAGSPQGPPVAVQRLVSGAFPLQFEIGAENSMMGQPLPPRMRIDVRADSDGDPMTRPDTDPKGFADGVELGKTGVRITVK
jgi:tetratricopeptide (TPR) repeat protein